LVQTGYVGQVAKAGGEGIDGKGVEGRREEGKGMVERNVYNMKGMEGRKVA
jgi:hypothetical protein